VLVLGFGAATAFADDAGPPTVPSSQGQALDEVVVTAQFRQQRLETTPVAITALSGAQLDEHNASSLASLNGLAPNLTVTAGTNTNGPSAQTFIRGIGQSDGHPGLEPGVGIYVDDVYHGLLLGSDLDLTDLDRAEVLRGPQGTLAGKNSIGGSIKLFTKKPDDQTDGYVSASYGDFNLVDVKAGGNFTLVPDTLYARVSAVSKQQDGYMKRLDYACVTGTDSSSTQIPVHGCQLGTEGGTDLHAVRLALRWLVSDTVENNFSATESQDRSEVPALKLLASNNTQGIIPGGNGSQFITGPTSYTSYATYMNLGFTDPQKYITAKAPGAGTHAAISLPTDDPINYYGLTDELE